MHVARRRPAVGAAADCAVAEGLAHARKLGGHRGERFIPGYFVEALVAGAFFSLTPAVADGGPRDAQRRVHHRRDRLEHVRGRGIARERLAADHAVILDQRREGAPMGKLREACEGHRGADSMDQDAR